jgi:basic membrane protein A
MHRLLNILSAALAAVTLFAVAPMKSAYAAEVRVVFLITQPLSPFEDDIWKAINKAKADGKASDVKLIEMKNPTEYEQTIRQVAEQGYDVIVSPFFFVKEAFNNVAPDFPKAHFVLVYESNEKNLPNMRGILYDVQEGSYVCGVVSGLMSKSGRVGFVGGNDSPGIIKFLAGYEAGLKSVKSDGKVDVTSPVLSSTPTRGARWRFPYTIAATTSSCMPPT